MIIVQNHSEVGGHAANEDAFAVQPHPQDENCWLCFVADGQGGQRGGGVASRLACETGIAEAGTATASGGGSLQDDFTAVVLQSLEATCR